MANQELGMHETLELHELLTFKTVCATKSATMVGLVNDSQLKSLMQQEVQASKHHINDLKNLLSTTIQ